MEPAASPLSREELAELESTLLPALERHHLRLLAHSLRTLQAIAGSRDGPPPGRSQLEFWALDVVPLQDDPPFRSGFLDQLEAAGRQLESIAAGLGTSPLALQLPQLVQWARAQAEARLEESP